MKKVDFTKMKIGSYVFSPNYGDGEIIYTEDDLDFPIVCVFDGGINISFTKYGYEPTDFSVYPSIYPSKFEIPDSAFEIPNPIPEIEAGMLIKAINNGTTILYNIIDAGKDELIAVSNTGWAKLSIINKQNIVCIARWDDDYFQLNDSKYENFSTIIWTKNKIGERDD